MHKHKINVILFNLATWLEYQQGFAADNKNIRLVEVPQDLLDFVWIEDRPPMPNELIYVHNLSYAGMFY